MKLGIHFVCGLSEVRKDAPKLLERLSTRVSNNRGWAVISYACYSVT